MAKKVTPFLWFNKDAGKVARFHCSVFPNSKILNENPMSVTYVVDGLKIMALNGGPHFKLNQAFSLFVSCKDQKEVDFYWSQLSKGATQMQCGWLTDKFGVTWQIIPSVLGSLIGDTNGEKAGRAFAGMMKMRKLDIAKLEAAHRGSAKSRGKKSR